MTAFNDLYTEILPDVPGCSEPLMDRAIRNAVVQFCERARVLRETLPKINVVADQAEYSCAPSDPTNRALVHVWHLTFEGKPVERKTEDQLDLEFEEAQDRYAYLFYHHHAYAGFDSDDWRTAKTSRPRYFYEKRPDKVRLVGIPTTAITDGLEIEIILKPTRAATAVDDFVIEDYYKTLAHGALAELLALPKKPWTDGGLSQYHRGHFEDGIAQAHADALRNFARDDRPVGRVKGYA